MFYVNLTTRRAQTEEEAGLVSVDDDIGNLALYCIDSSDTIRKVFEPISGTAFSIQIEGL